MEGRLGGMGGREWGRGSAGAGRVAGSARERGRRALTATVHRWKPLSIPACEHRVRAIPDLPPVTPPHPHLCGIGEMKHSEARQKLP